MSEQRKILYSPGFGAGWTTWEHNDDVKRLMLTYQPIIEALERGETVGADWKIERDLTSDKAETRARAEKKLHPAMQQLFADVRAMGKDVPYIGGADQLRVLTVHGRVRIEDYDGNESVEEEGDYAGWL